MQAMTWWDHDSPGIWSQPWGMALGGPLKGTRLKLIPAAILPWGAWLEGHPNTLVLEDEDSLFGPLRKEFNPNFVVGIALGEDAKAYPFKLASEEGAVNDRIGPYPVVVIANPGNKSVYTYIRQAADQELDFRILKEAPPNSIIDAQTGSTWDATRGIAIAGPLRGEVLQRVPYITAYDWAWKDFFPHTQFYTSE